jgi:hypothetical protein
MDPMYLPRFPIPTPKKKGFKERIIPVRALEKERK